MEKRKTIWLTGASSGIGLETAKLLSQLDVNLVLSSRRVDVIEQQFNHSTQADIFIKHLDLSSQDSIYNCYNQIAEEIGSVDVLINNAGTFTAKSFVGTTIEQYDAMMNVNLRGVFLITQCVLPNMIASRKGIIINIESATAIKTFPYCSIYSASKAGMLAMMRSLRAEVKKYGIKIIDILPGAAATNIWGPNSKEPKELMSQPEEIAGIIAEAVNLCRYPSSMIEEIVVNPQYYD